MRLLVASVWVCTLLAAGCLPPPQRENEVALNYRASFSTTPAAQASVVFPFVSDGAQQAVRGGLTLSDGGVAKLEGVAGGSALLLSGFATASAQFSFSNVTGVDVSSGVPNITLSTVAEDAGVNVKVFSVDAPTDTQVTVNFEYAASQDCGTRCGGMRRFVYSGPLVNGTQTVQLQVSEMEKRE
jgi:hypothetical protein